MVQVIGQGRLKPKSFGQQIGEGVSRLAQMGSSYALQEQEKAKEEQRYNQQIQALNQLSGMDLSGIRDPRILQEIAKVGLSNKFSPEKDQQKIVSKALSGQKLTNEELSSLPQNVQLQLARLGQQKGATSFQSVPQEISQAMNEVVSSLPNASADELKMKFDELGVPPGYSNAYVENRRRQDERAAASKDKRLESGQKRAEKVLDRADTLGEELPILESSIMAMEDAVTNGDQSFWSLDNLAEMTGLELFRTAKGGQFKTAAKTYFINDLKASGARPNMFIERQLSDALAKVGRSQEANQTVIESFKFSNDLKRKWLETVRDLEKYYEKSMGYLPGSFNSRVEEMMAPYVKDRQKQYENRLKELHVQEKKKSMKKKNSSESSSRMIGIRGPNGELADVLESEVGDLPEGWVIE